MSSLRLDATVLTFRYYDEDNIDTTKFLSDESAPYVLVGTVTILDNEAHISATLGAMRPDVLTKLGIELYKLGVVKMRWRHKNKQMEKTIDGVY